MLLLALLAVRICAYSASTASVGWPKAQRWVSWWFMPYNGSAYISKAAAGNVVQCVKEHQRAFDSVIIFCGHKLELNGSISVDNNLLAFCEEALVGPLRELGVVIEFVIGEGTGRNITAMRRAFASPTREQNIALLKEATMLQSVSGWSFDWEPPGSSPTYADRLAFADFVGELRFAVSPLGARVSVDMFGPSDAMIGGYSSMAPNVEMLYDMETYDARGNFSWWLEQYEKFVNSSGTDKYNDTQFFPISKASPGFDIYEAEAQAILKPRIERLIDDSIPELFIFQIWVGFDGIVAIPDFWWQHVEAYKRGVYESEATSPMSHYYTNFSSFDPDN